MAGTALGAQGTAKCPWLLIFLPGARKCSEPTEAGAGLSTEEAGLAGSLWLGQGPAPKDSPGKADKKNEHLGPGQS